MKVNTEVYHVEDFDVSLNCANYRTHDDYVTRAGAHGSLLTILLQGVDVHNREDDSAYCYQLKNCTL